jgi:hypothetical protein
VEAGGVGEQGVEGGAVGGAQHVGDAARAATAEPTRTGVIAAVSVAGRMARTQGVMRGAVRKSIARPTRSRAHSKRYELAM